MTKFWIFLLFGCPIILQVTRGVNSATSPKESPRGLENVNGTLYYITPDGIRFSTSQGKKICEEENMKLVSFETAEKEKLFLHFIKEKGYNDSYWTSGQRTDGGPFVWTGTGQLIEGYTNWDTQMGEPDDYGNCVLLTRINDKWWAHDCNAPQGIVCEQ